jgi:hypothetical protein
MKRMIVGETRQRLQVLPRQAAPGGNKMWQKSQNNSNKLPSMASGSTETFS